MSQFTESENSVTKKENQSHEAEKISYIRKQMPSTLGTVYFNTGTSGPLPLAVFEEMKKAEESDFYVGRASTLGFADLTQNLLKAREQLAGFLGANASEITLTHHTTEGINIVLWGLNWSPGDEIVTTSIEHEGIVIPLAHLRHRKGVTVRYTHVGAGEKEETLQAIEAALTPRTRLVALSHVSFSTGALLPLKEIVEMAHTHHIMVLVDGAQSVGAIPLNLRELGVDFYAFPGQKWLCGPEGTGGLYIRNDRIGEIEPTYVGYFSMKQYDFKTPYFLPAEGARRFEVGTVYRPGIAGLRASLGWLSQQVEASWAYQRIQKLVKSAREQLASLAHVSILTPENQEAGLLNFYIKDADPDAFVREAAKGGITLRFIPDNGSLRISTGYYNTEEEIAQLAGFIRHKTGE